MFHFHSWKEIEKKEPYVFEGITLQKMVPTGYRYCKKCHTIQSYRFDSQGGSWEKLTKDEQEVVRNKYL